MSRINPRVTAAAAKLALFYSAFIALETLVLVLALGPQAWPLIELVPAAVIFLAVPFFFGAFLLFVVARRLALIAFWILLLSFWVFLLNSIPAVEFPQFFVFWSILALPIWLIGHVGISDRSSSRLHLGSVRVSPAAALLACWALMIAGARLYGIDSVT